MSEEIKSSLDKEVVKEAIKEWMGDQMKAFGWWTFKGLLSLAFGGACYLAAVKLGFAK
ncbi:hypothetical protein [Ralstonia mannitolilytica]|uniref:hypothetical protein n=1 Tax=Ralstonia mannitolilytica TaxID=105219 RepID=UPI000B11CC66|nr:hypothetical protein [Ralstonia mannitolilytica]